MAGSKSKIDTRRIRATEVPRLALDMDEAGEAMGGFSRPLTYDLVNEGKLRTFLIGRRRFASIEAIEECIRILEAQVADLPNVSGHNHGNSIKGAKTAPGEAA